MKYRKLQKEGDKIILPMLCQKVDNLPVDDNYIYEFKADGGRIIAYIKDGKVKLYTRSGNIVNNKFPEIIEGLRKLPNCILDGEIVIFNNGKTDFTLYQKRVMSENPFQIQLMKEKYPATYIVFDILELNEDDLTFYSLMERKKVLANVLHNNIDCIKPIIYYKTPHFLLQKRGLIEGIVAKRKDSIYEAGKRSGAWVKYRFIKEAVVRAVDYEITPSGIVAIDEYGNRITVNGRVAVDVMQTISEYGYADIEINYYEKTEEGKYRFPSFKRLRRRKDEAYC